MKNVLLTGFSSGIGYGIAKTLLKHDFKVYGVSRRAVTVDIQHENLIKINCDLSNLSSLEKTLQSLKKINFDVIINVAGVGYFGPHEEINIYKIKNMIAVNLQAPLIICQYFLRNMKKNGGNIINISSVTATKSSPYGLAYSATKAGLAHFSEGLFDEVRKYGIKVTNINPDMTDTNFYENSNFECDKNNELNFLNVDDVVEAVMYVLNAKNNNVITTINLKSQFHSINRKKIGK